MAIEGDNAGHETELENQNEQILSRLEAIIFLLEIIADVEIGETLKNIGA